MPLQQRGLYRFPRAAVKILGVLALLIVPYSSARADLDQSLGEARAIEATIGRLSAWLADAELDSMGAFFSDPPIELKREARLLRLHGAWLSAIGKDQEAVASLEAALRQNPGLAEAHLDLGLLLLRRGQRGRALAELEAAAAGAPQSLDALLALANCLRQLRRPEAARGPLERAGRLAPQDPRVLRTAARLAIELDDPEAAALWRLEEERSPDAETARQLAKMLPSEARIHYEACARRDPTASDCSAAAGSLALETGENGAAIRWLHRAIQSGEEAAARENLFLALSRRAGLGDLVLADSLAAARPPGSPAGWGSLALLRRAAGKLAGATAALEEARAQLGDHPELLNLQGVVEDERGRRKAARALWKRVLELDPDHAGATNNLRERPARP